MLFKASIHFNCIRNEISKGDLSKIYIKLTNIKMLMFDLKCYMTSLPERCEKKPRWLPVTEEAACVRYAQPST